MHARFHFSLAKHSLDHPVQDYFSHLWSFSFRSTCSHSIKCSVSLWLDFYMKFYFFLFVVVVFHPVYFFYMLCFIFSAFVAGQTLPAYTWSHFIDELVVVSFFADAWPYFYQFGMILFYYLFKYFTLVDICLESFFFIDFCFFLECLCYSVTVHCEIFSC